MSDFYQGKPIRPDRGMMILGHHHSGDNAPTNPTTPSSIRQPKTPSHAPSFPCSALTPSPTYSPFLLLPLACLLFPSFPRDLLSQCSPPFRSHPIVPYFICFLSFCHRIPFLPSPPSHPLTLSDGKHKDKFCPFLSP